MERLTKKEKIKFSHGEDVVICKHDDSNCNDSCMKIHQCNWLKMAQEKLWNYENAEEQGLLLKLPCKVGTHIYIINRYWIDEGQIIGLAECDDVDCACFKVYEDPDTYSMVAFNEFGKTWFLTEEEAERKLEGLQG